MNCFVIAVGLTIACAPSTVEEPAPSPPDTDVSEDTASGSGLVVTGQGWAIGTTPSALDQTWFGPTVEGSTEAHEFVLTNTGASEIVEIEGAVSGSGFSLVEPLPPRLEGHETGLFQLVYAAEPGSPSAEAEVQITWAGGELVFSVAGVARSAWNKESDQSEGWGHVQFARSEVLSAGELVEADLRDLAEVLTATWVAYLGTDAEGYATYSDANVVRFSEVRGHVGIGDELAAQLEADWVNYERPVTPWLSNRVEVQEFSVRSDGEGALVDYVIQEEYGARWPGSGLRRAFEAYTRQDGQWRLATHHTTGGIVPLREGWIPLSFDFVYPVTDIERALAFYEPFLGTPETSTTQGLSWNLGRPRFRLIDHTLGGRTPTEGGLPSGYVMFYTTEDIHSERERLVDLGVDVVSEVLDDLGPDPYLIAQDPAGSPFLWVQRVGQHDATGQGPEVTWEASLSDAPGGLAEAAEALLEDWASADAEGVTDVLLSDGVWWDAWGWAQGVGPDAVQEALRGMESGSANRVFDTTENGLAIRVTIREAVTQGVGAYELTSLLLDIEGLGAHLSRDEVWLTLAWVEEEAQWRLANAIAGIADFGADAVLSLDYTGYPENKLEEAEELFSDLLAFGEPYTDWGYYGWWAEDTVFGIYQAKKAFNGIPRPGVTNGYASLWVEDAEETYAQLEAAGATFPQIPAINGNSGVDEQPGYIQVLAVDSEGNGVLFSEYPGD